MTDTIDTITAWIVTEPAGNAPRERLLLIADALDDVPPERLELGVWRRPYDACGSIACALGWGIIKHGDALGMTFGPGVRGGDVPYLHGERLFEVATNTDWSRLAEHLGINKDACSALFGGSGRAYGTLTPTPKMVAAKIRWVADTPHAMQRA